MSINSLPLELIDIILQVASHPTLPLTKSFVYPPRHQHRLNTLVSTSLVCREWSLLSQRLLWRDLALDTLRNDSKSGQDNRLERLFTSRSLGKYSTRNLRIHFGDQRRSSYDVSYDILVGILDHLYGVQNVWIQNFSPKSEFNFALDVLQHPTLHDIRTLYLHDVAFNPIPAHLSVALPTQIEILTIILTQPNKITSSPIIKQDSPEVSDYDFDSDEEDSFCDAQLRKRIVRQTLSYSLVKASIETMQRIRVWVELPDGNHVKEEAGLSLPFIK